MGANLSSLEWKNRDPVGNGIPPDVVDKFDRYNDFVLLALWGGSLYIIAMIFTTCQLIDRWRGPRDEGSVNFFSVLGAFIMATLWPAVLVILALNN